MSKTQAKLKADARYNAKLDQIAIRVPKGDRERYKAYAESRGESLTGMIVRLVEKEIESSNGGKKTMTKKQAFEMAGRHNMTIARNPITREGTGWYLQFVQPIPEPDRLADTKEGQHEALPCAVVRERYEDEYTYKLTAPRGWITLWD